MMRAKGSGTLLSDMSGRATLLGVLVTLLLTYGFLALFGAQKANAWLGKSATASCLSGSNCHYNSGIQISGANIYTSVNGVAGTTGSVAQGGTFEVSWIYTGVNGGKIDDGPLIAIQDTLVGGAAAQQAPQAGTITNPAFTGATWNAAGKWNAADGVGWYANKYTDANLGTGYTGFSINYAGTAWDSGTAGHEAEDDGLVNDQDGTPSAMGTNARITVPASTATGNYTVKVYGVGHQSSTKAFVMATITITVTPAPTITSTSPASRGQGATSQNITINGTGFQSGATVVFNATGITENGAATYGSATQLTQNITVASNATTGLGTVTVTNPDGSSATASVFTVNAGPTVTSTSPTSMTQGTGPTTVTITGTGFQSGATVAFSGTGITLGSVTYVNATTLTVPVTVAAGATVGARNVTVTNPDAGTGTGTGVFSVTSNLTSTTTTVSNPSAITYGQNASFTATVSPSAATGTVQFKVDGTNVSSPVTLSGGSATLTGVSGLSAGSHTVTAVYSGDATYASSTSPGASQTVNKATPTLSVTNSPVTYDGTAKSANVNGSVAGTVSNILTGGAASQTNAGTYAVTANFTPTDTTNYTTLTGASAGNFVISQAMPTASITNSPVVYNGSAQTATVACTGGGTATLASGGTGTNAGSYPATVNCAASTNYTAASGLSAGSFVINKATPTASVTNSPQTYDGSAKIVAVSCLGGGTVSNITPASQTNAGSYPVTADCAASTNYNAATGLSAGNFLINAATPTASITNSPVIYNGSVQTATVACLGGGTATLASGGTGTNAGSYPATVNCAASTNYTAASGLSAGSFVINKATPTASV
ncbi:MAG TPA: Ig-like domain repeat protein, partial [Geobacteraceae bacterium]